MSAKPHPALPRVLALASAALTAGRHAWIRPPEGDEDGSISIICRGKTRKLDRHACYTFHYFTVCPFSDEAIARQALENTSPDSKPC